MTMMIRGASAALLSVLLAVPAQAVSPASRQPPQPTMAAPAPVQGRPLTNGQVISLAKSGLPDDALIDIVLASQPHFNLSSVDRAILAHTGVSPRVIQAMLTAMSEPARIGVKASVRPEKSADPKPSGICVAVWCW
jgi:hypothetical protein